MKKKIFSAVTALALCLSLLPAGALASDPVTVVTVTSAEELKTYFEQAGYKAESSVPNKISIQVPDTPDPNHPTEITADLQISCNVSIEITGQLDMGGHYILINRGANVEISQMGAGGITGTGSNTQNAVVAAAPGSILTLRSITIASSGGAGSCGVRVMPSIKKQDTTLTLEDVTIEANQDSGIGICLESSAATTITGSCNISGATGIKIKSGTLNIGTANNNQYTHIHGYGLYSEASDNTISDGSAILIQSSGGAQLSLGPNVNLISSHSYAICEFVPRGGTASKINIESRSEWVYNMELASPVQVKNPGNVTVSDSGDAWKNAPRQPQTIKVWSGSQDACFKAGLTLEKQETVGLKQCYPLTIDRLKLNELASSDPDAYESLKDPQNSSTLRFYVEYTAPLSIKDKAELAVIEIDGQYHPMTLDTPSKDGFRHYVTIKDSYADHEEFKWPAYQPAGQPSALIRWLDENSSVLAVTEANVEIRVLPTYQVIFQDNGAKFAEETVTEGGLVSKPDSEPAKEGFIFGGWLLNGVPWKFETRPVTEDTTLEAYWRSSLKVTFHGNGGSFQTEGKPSLEVSVLEGGTVSPPTPPVLEGCQFNGWYKDPECTVPWDFKTPVIASTTLTAKWLKNPIVTFHYQDEGVTADAETIVDYGGKLEQPEAPEREGYIFEGWYKDEEGKEAWNFNTPLTEDLALYAKWAVAPVTHTVTFDTKGGSSVSEKTAAEGTTINSPAAPSKEGFLFGGWYKDEAYKTLWDFETDTVDTNITLFARWLAAFTVTFDSQGGSQVDSQTVAEGGAAKKPNDPTKAGYLFKGWYQKGDDSALWDFEKNTVAENLTLYAKWEELPPETYTITFNSQGGSQVDSFTVIEGQLIQQPNNPVREGWSFAGWFLEADCVNVWNFDNDKANKSVTLYAKWTQDVPPEQEKYTVTFDSQGGSQVNPATAVKNGTVAKPADPARSGYTFGGWFKESSCVNLWDFSTGKVTADLTLYAKWTRTDHDRTSYLITVCSDIRYGQVRVSHSQADRGTRVTITVEPDSDSRLSWVEAVKEDGSALSLDRNGSRYTFTMPASDVTVDAGFTLQHVYTGSATLPDRPVQTVPTLVFTPVEYRSAPAFQDISGDSWAAPAASWAYQNGYLDAAPDGAFRLDGLVSHQQMWKIMARWLDAPAVSERDINDWAYQSGAAKGGSPHSVMTRQDVVIYLYKCCFLMGGDVSAKNNLASYSDNRLIQAKSARNAWAWAVERGIITGTDSGRLEPNGPISRGEFAAILMRLCQNSLA